MKHLVALLAIICILCSCAIAQESGRQAVAINFKDTTKKAVTGTLVSLDMKQVSIETDEVRHLGLKIDLGQVASIIFFDIPLTAKTVKPSAPAYVVVCGETTIKRPVLRRLHIGMTIDEAKAVWPSLRVRAAADEAGEQRAYLVQPDEGVSSISLEFLDGRLKYIEVTYNNSVRWNSEEQFYSRIAESFGLPTSWRGLSECQGLNLDAEYNSGIIPRIHLYDPSAKQTIKKRRADIEEKKQREFKP